jgi:hypothetical protein
MRLSIWPPITGVLRQVTSTEWTSVDSNGTTVSYILGPDVPDGQRLTDYYMVTIQVCSDVCKATDIIKNFLSGFQNIDADDNAVQPVTTARLGDYAFRTPTSVF